MTDGAVEVEGGGETERTVEVDDGVTTNEGREVGRGERAVSVLETVAQMCAGQVSAVESKYAVRHGGTAGSCCEARDENASARDHEDVLGGIAFREEDLPCTMFPLVLLEIVEDLDLARTHVSIVPELGDETRLAHPAGSFPT